MISEGLTELMFTSDNLWEMEHKKYYLPGGICTILSSLCNSCNKSLHFIFVDKDG